MFKNVASQKLIVYVFDSTTNLPKTGDAANLTAYVSKDYGAVTVLGDTSATEMDSTNAKGYYLFDLTQGETNGDTLLFSCKSATANMVALAMPATVFTVPANFTAFSIDSNGRIDVIKVAGTTQTARDIGASVLLSAGSGTGQLDFTSGVVKANVTQFGGSAGTFASGRAEVNTTHIAGSIVSTASAQLGVNVVNAAGTAWGSGAITAASIAAAALNGKGDWNIGKTGYSLSAAGVQAIWDALTSALTTVGSVGKRIADFLTGDAYVRLGAPAGASTAADIAAVKTDTAAVKVQADKMVFTVANQLDVNVLDWKSATAPAMTGDAYARLGAPAGASVSADIAAVRVDTQLVTTTAQAELSAVPASNASPLSKLNWLFLVARNKLTQTSTQQKVLANDGVTVVGTSAVSDDGTTATRGVFS